MSSLYSRIVKTRKLAGIKPFDYGVTQLCLKKLLEVGPVLVDIRSVADYLDGRQYSLFEAAQDITPCHTEMWLEYLDTTGRVRIATWVTRLYRSEVTPELEDALFEVSGEWKFLIHFASFHEHHDSALLSATHWIMIDESGKHLGFAEQYPPDDVGLNFAKNTHLVACEALTCMNTKGTHVEPPFGKPPAPVVKPNRAPQSVWHTVRVPQVKREPLGANADGPVIERREHWVRAHRADYRVGGGLFGRIHQLIWVPEHKRGNPELGTVKQSYTVEKK